MDPFLLDGLGLGHLGRQRAEELVLLLLRLEAAVTVLGRGVDELELHLLQHTSRVNGGEGVKREREEATRGVSAMPNRARCTQHI